MIFLLFFSFSVHASDALKENLKTQILRSFPKGTEVKIEKFHVTGKIPEEASLMLLSPQPPVGLINFELAGSGSKVYGTAVARVFAKIAIARTNIQNLEALNEENILFEKRELGPFVGMGFFDSKVLFSSLARGFIRPGRIIHPSDVQMPLAIHPGQKLSLILSQGNVKITAKVRALEGGEVSRWIHVENPSTKKVLLARITGVGEATLH